MNGLQLRDALTDLGLSQAELSRYLGVTRRAVVYWVRGERRIPAGVVQAIGLARRRGYWRVKP